MISQRVLDVCKLIRLESVRRLVLNRDFERLKQEVRVFNRRVDGTEGNTDYMRINPSLLTSTRGYTEENYGIPIDSINCTEMYHRESLED